MAVALVATEEATAVTVAMAVALVATEEATAVTAAMADTVVIATTTAAIAATAVAVTEVTEPTDFDELRTATSLSVPFGLGGTKCITG